VCCPSVFWRNAASLTWITSHTPADAHGALRPLPGQREVVGRCRNGTLGLLSASSFLLFIAKIVLGVLTLLCCPAAIDILLSG
jgi:hypothetical protein